MHLLSTFQPGLISAPRTVTVTSVSNHPVTFKSITHAEEFTAANSCPATLNPIPSCVIEVVFTPPDVGTWIGTLSAADSAPDSPQIAALSGVGLDK